MNETGSQLTYQPADRPPELRRPEDYPFPCCRGSGESWRAICCLESSAYQDAHRSPGALIRQSLLCVRARRSRELPCRSMKHGPSARGTEAERRGDCRSAATGPIILAEHDLFRARVGKSRIRNSLGGNGEGVKCGSEMWLASHLCEIANIAISSPSTRLNLGEPRAPVTYTGRPFRQPTEQGDPHSY